MSTDTVHSCSAAATPQKPRLDSVVAEVRRQLLASHFSVFRQIQCNFYEGVLILRGQVPTFYHRQVAVELAKKVNGVEQIDDRLVVDRLAVTQRKSRLRNQQMSDFSLLLVDDEEELLESFETWFSARGFHVTTAHHPSLALAAAAHNEFDAAVIDVTLPEMNGLELIDKLKSMCDFPIIMLSGDDNPRLIDAALERGVYRFLAKPVSMRDVEVVIQESLRHSPLPNSMRKSATFA